MGLTLMHHSYLDIYMHRLMHRYLYAHTHKFTSSATATFFGANVCILRQQQFPGVSTYDVYQCSSYGEGRIKMGGGRVNNNV